MTNESVAWSPYSPGFLSPDAKDAQAKLGKFDHKVMTTLADRESNATETPSAIGSNMGKQRLDEDVRRRVSNMQQRGAQLSKPFITSSPAYATDPR